MAVICRKCGKTVSDKVNACYNCGELLQPPVKCGGCGRENVAGRKQCAYCGDPLEQAAAPAAASAPAIGDPNAAAALNQLFGAAAGAPPASAPSKRSGNTRMGFEDDAPKAVRLTLNPAPVGSQKAPPPPAHFEVLPAAPSNQTNSWLSRDEMIDIALLILAAPAAVWGMMVMLCVILLTMMRGGPGLSTFFSRITNPHWASYIFPGLLGVGVAYLISANSTPDSDFWYRYAFIITAGSFGFGIWLVARRIMRRIKPRRSANDVFRV